MEKLVKPLPRISAANRPYFDATQRGALSIQRCRACGKHVFFPREACPHCLAVDGLEWVDASGHGQIYSYCIVHRPQHPAFYDEVPIIFAAIELAEGPVMLSEVRGLTPEQVRIGMPVRVDFTRITDEITIPVWVPTQA